MNSYSNVLKEARDLPTEEVNPYFDKNFPARTGIYQLCKGCKHILLAHTTQKGSVDLSHCRSCEDKNYSRICRSFK